MLPLDFIQVEVCHNSMWQVCGHLEYHPYYLNFQWCGNVSRRVFGPKVRRVFKLMALPVEILS